MILFGERGRKETDTIKDDFWIKVTGTEYVLILKDPTEIIQRIKLTKDKKSGEIYPRGEFLAHSQEPESECRGGYWV